MIGQGKHTARVSLYTLAGVAVLGVVLTAGARQLRAISSTGWS
jgi:hypothetical protein